MATPATRALPVTAGARNRTRRRRARRRARYRAAPGRPRPAPEGRCCPRKGREGGEAPSSPTKRKRCITVPTSKETARPCTRAPRMKEPTTFTASVPKGKPPPMSEVEPALGRAHDVVAPDRTQCAAQRDGEGDLHSSSLRPGGARSLFAQLLPVGEALQHLALEAPLARLVRSCAAAFPPESSSGREPFLGVVVVDVALAVAESSSAASAR